MTLTSENIAAYADTLVLQVRAGGRTLDYSSASVAIIEDLMRVSDELLCAPNFPDEQRNLLIFYTGCYMGEVLARTLGGVWRFDEDEWSASSLVFAHSGEGGLQVFPFEKVRRRATNGAETNNLVAYYDGLKNRLEKTCINLVSGGYLSTKAVAA